MPGSASLPLDVLWTVEVPGDRSHVVMADVHDRSVFVSDGWGVPYAALRLRRLSLDDGRELASVRTRHQPVGALAHGLAGGLAGGRLWAATDRRLLALDPRSLDLVDQWDKGLVRHTQTLVPVPVSGPTGGRLVMANWLTPMVGVFDPANGSTRRLRVGPQPLVVADGGTVRLIAGFDGGIATLDLAGKLTARRPTPPVTAAVALGDGSLWAVRAGQSEGGRGRNPPAWSRAVTDELVRLDGDAPIVELPERCQALFAGPDGCTLWCVLRAADGPELAIVDPGNGAVVARYHAPGGGALVHVDPAADLVFALRPATPPSDEDRRRASLSACRIP